MLPCGATLPNRLAKAAMSEQLADRSGRPTEAMIRLYERWGRGGSGLLITGNVMLDSNRLGEAGNVIVEDERDLDILSRWATAATQEGSHAWVQINHPGRQAPRSTDPHPVAPSAVPMKVGRAAFAAPRALDGDEIEEIIARFARTAKVIQAAGFTGVQIHGAHGYLVSQFLSPLTNKRDDRWGGTTEGRSRFLIEIIRTMRAAVGPAFPLSVKLNSADFQRGGITQEETLSTIMQLEAEEIDLLEISGGTYERAAMFSERESTKAREAFFSEFAESARAVTTVPIMLTGGFRTLAAMEQAVASGAVDVIGMARPFAVEPDLPSKLLTGQSQAAASIKLSSGLKTLDSMVIGSWYQHQLRRMGRGRDPKLNQTRAGAMLSYLVDYLQRGSRLRRGL